MADVVKRYSISSELAQKMVKCSGGEKPENLALPRT